MTLLVRIFALTVVILAAVPAFALAQCEQGEKVLRLGVSNDDVATATGRLGKEIRTEFQRSLNGKACVEIIADTKIANGEGLLQSVSKEAEEFAAAVVPFSELGNRAPLFNIVSLPFAFDHEHSAKRFVSGLKPTDWRITGADGAKPLSIAWFGLDQVVARLPLLMPEDVVGLKFPRTDRFTDTMLAELKAVQPDIPPAERAAALADGRFDGSTGNLVELGQRKTTSPLAKIVRTNHMLKGALIALSERHLSVLPAELAEQVETTFRSGVEKFNQAEERREATARRQLRSNGNAVYVLTRKQRNAWRAAVAPLRKSVEEDAAHAALLNAVKQANRF